jgi:hypothetical protein
MDHEEYLELEKRALSLKAVSESEALFYIYCLIAGHLHEEVPNMSLSEAVLYVVKRVASGEIIKG